MPSFVWFSIGAFAMLMVLVTVATVRVVRKGELATSGPNSRTAMKEKIVAVKEGPRGKETIEGGSDVD